MAPFIVPPLIKFALGAAGAAAIVHWAVQEVRRLSEELERAKRVKIGIRPEQLPKLRRDPVSGVWRLRNQ
jgi:DNA-directed RNA polymerase subunit H (RpoH/RPB5)